MATDDIQRKAIPYYACYVIGQMSNRDTATLTELLLDSATQSVNAEGSPFLLENVSVLRNAMLMLEEARAVRFVPDEFGPDIVVRRPDFFDSVTELLNSEGSVFNKYKLAGNGSDAWLRLALRAVNKRLKDTKVENTEKQEIQTDSVEWEPLPIDRESSDFQHALETSERALETIEQNNGYAAAHPEERNGIVETIKGTLSAIKEGNPSKASIREGLLKPFRYMSQKFTDSVMGEFSKLAVAAIIKWLFS